MASESDPAGVRDGDPVILLMGPTACGKTEAALAIADALADEWPVEIVSVDSAQVYRGMDIGTAKPDAATLSRYPHHLVDVAEPTEAYNAGRFRDEALAAIADIHRRGHLPLLVGGTMLYFKALLEGLSELPAADPELRSALDARGEAEGWPALHAELARRDPEAAARIAANDRQRIQRALEIMELTGRPASAVQAEEPGAGLEAPTLRLALVPGNRAALHERIARRFQRMMEAGLLEEVERLRSLPGMHRDLPAMRSVGYRQLWQYLEGEHGLEDAIQRGIIATRRLSKRQLTWLRSMDALEAVPVEAPEPSEALLTRLRRWLGIVAEPG